MGLKSTKNNEFFEFKLIPSWVLAIFKCDKISILTKTLIKQITRIISQFYTGE